MTNTEIIDRIRQLKKEKNAVILAHYYTRPEVQDIADYLGDSLGLSQDQSRQLFVDGEAAMIFAVCILWRRPQRSFLRTKRS